MQLLFGWHSPENYPNTIEQPMQASGDGKVDSQFIDCVDARLVSYHLARLDKLSRNGRVPLA